MWASVSPYHKGQQQQKQQGSRKQAQVLWSPSWQAQSMDDGLPKVINCVYSNGGAT